MHPLFSIITVCYNADATIGRTMESVAAQGFDDYEHIIVDGASKDGTLDKVRMLSTSVSYTHLTLPTNSRV